LIKDYKNSPSFENNVFNHQLRFRVGYTGVLLFIFWCDSSNACDFLQLDFKNAFSAVQGSFFDEFG
jgi:hypothetical protein